MYELGRIGCLLRDDCLRGCSIDLAGNADLDRQSKAPAKRNREDSDDNQ